MMKDGSAPGGWNGHADREAAYMAAGYWRAESLVDIVRANCVAKPNGAAYVEGVDRWTWADADELSDAWATTLLDLGLQRNDRLAVLLPDGATVQIGFLAAEKAGIVAVGIGARAGAKEITHLIRRTGATVLLSGAEHDGAPTVDIVDRLRDEGLHIDHHVVVADDLSQVMVDSQPHALIAKRDLIEERRFGPNNMSIVNSTSGTTGMPKCVMHNQNRWWYFHQLAQAAADLTPDDNFYSAVPMPFGFGLWTSHFTPAYLGAQVGLMRRFSPTRMLDDIESQRVTVLSCVTTQFIMMMNAADSAHRDLSSLRVLFTGGEAVPYDRAAEFEDRFGASVLQFYGSNETGALSRTTLGDSREARFGTAGRIIPEMNVIMLDPHRERIPNEGTRGQPACIGPATSLGYWDDDAANAELFTDDGWMLMGDMVEIDDDQYLRVVGRVGDFIIRGGKNISAPAVEAEVATHPSIALVAAVADPDAVLGERVGLYVTLKPGSSLTLDALVTYLRERGMSKDSLPERLTILDELPMSSGGKVAKGELRLRASSTE